MEFLNRELHLRNRLKTLGLLTWKALRTVFRFVRRAFAHFWAERIFERFEHSRLQIEVSQIIIHKANQRVSHR